MARDCPGPQLRPPILFRPKPTSEQSTEIDTFPMTAGSFYMRSWEQGFAIEARNVEEFLSWLHSVEAGIKSPTLCTSSVQIRTH